MRSKGAPAESPVYRVSGCDRELPHSPRRLDFRKAPLWANLGGAFLCSLPHRWPLDRRRRRLREFGLKSGSRRYLAVILSKLQEMITFFLVAGSPGAIREIFSGLEMRC